MSSLSEIHWKLREADFYLKTMNEQSRSLFANTRPLGFSWQDPTHVRNAQVFLFLFSGFLGAFGSVIYYMHTVCEKNRSSWLSDRRRKALSDKSLLAAFAFLRNNDVHEKTLSLGAGVRHTFNLDAKSSTSEFVLNGAEISKIEKFGEYPWAVALLTEHPVTSVSADALGELRSVVQEGRNSGIF